MFGRRSFLIAVAGLAVAGCAALPEPTPHGRRVDLRAYAGPTSRPPVYPSFVSSANRDAYEFAIANPKVLNSLACYCGCGLGIGHRSNLDCFVAGVDAGGAVVFDEHGSFCQTCVDIARDARLLLAEGRSLREIRTEVDARHSGKGPGTNTPLPDSA